MPAGYVAMMIRDRARLGFTIGQAAWSIGVSPREYRELEAGERWPNYATWERMCEVFGWPQAFEGR